MYIIWDAKLVYRDFEDAFDYFMSEGNFPDFFEWEDENEDLTEGLTEGEVDEEYFEEAYEAFDDWMVENGKYIED